MHQVGATTVRPKHAFVPLMISPSGVLVKIHYSVYINGTLNLSSLAFTLNEVKVEFSVLPTSTQLGEICSINPDSQQ
jgi:hypothetical protein